MVAPGQTFNPTIDAGQKVEQHFYLPGQGQNREMPKADTNRPRHNVKFIGIKTIPANSESPILITACFQNVLIPHTPLANFSFAKVKITFFDSLNKEIGDVFPAVWAEDEGPSISLEGGVTHSAVVAAYAHGKWKVGRVKTSSTYWEGESHTFEEEILPLGSLRAVIVLFGERNISLPPVEVSLTLREDGTADIRQE